MVGSEPAPEVTKERFFEVGIDFNSTKAAKDDDTNAMTFDFLNDTEEGSKASSGMKFNFLADVSGDDSKDGDVQPLAASAGQWLVVWYAMEIHVCFLTEPALNCKAVATRGETYSRNEASEAM